MMIQVDTFVQWEYRKLQFSQGAMGYEPYLEAKKSKWVFSEFREWQDLVEALNMLGSEGWECIGVYDDGLKPFRYALLKRPKVEP